jgi:UDP-GlcNAc:undecaprenyl-phosphate GlcNAc-1-phosphate transferase
MATAMGAGLILAEARSPGSVGTVWMLAIPALALLVLGTIDDIHKLSVWTRLAVELFLGAVAAFLIVESRLPTVSPSWLWIVEGRLPTVSEIWPWIAVGAATAFLVGTINAINMQDGMDGLAGVLVMLSALGMVAASRGTAPPAAAVPLAALAGAVLGFLLFNAPPASVFMGNGGSNFLGFVIATGALWLAASKPSPSGVLGSLLLVGVPLFEGSITIVRRCRRGVSPLQGDREHLYDRLAAAGWSPWAVLGVATFAQALAVFAGLYLFLNGNG